MPPDEEVTLDKVEEDIRTRDENDSTRQLAPLKPADDAIKIDTTNLGIDAVVEKMISIIAERTI